MENSFVSALRSLIERNACGTNVQSSNRAQLSPGRASMQTCLKLANQFICIAPRFSTGI